MDFADLAIARGPSPGCSLITTTTWRSRKSGSPSAFYGTLASSNYFEYSVWRPILGRRLNTARMSGWVQRSGASVYGLCQNHFGADPSIIGKTFISICIRTRLLVVAPERLQGCKGGLTSDIWIPLGMIRRFQARSKSSIATTLWLNVLGSSSP